MSINVYKKSSNVLRREVHRKSRQENMDTYTKSLKRIYEKQSGMKGQNILEANILSTN